METNHAAAANMRADVAARKCLRAALVLLAATAGSSVVAQGYPAKPIRLVLPFPPGGSTDIVARLLGQKLTESWGQPVLVDNRPGAGGNVAAEAVSRAAPDGYTLFQVNVANAIGATLYPKLNYDLLASFAPVIHLATTPYVLLAHRTVPARTIRELVALAKAQPAKLNYASAGSGSATHLSGELLKAMSATNIVHIPYRGTGPAVTALLAGEVDLYFATVPAAMPLVNSNRVRALGVTSSRRSSLMPAVPTIAEAGLQGYETSTWHGVLVPVATSNEVVVKLNAEMARILALPDVRERLVGQGLDPVGGTPEQFGAYLKLEIAKWARLVKASGARPE